MALTNSNIKQLPTIGSTQPTPLAQQQKLSQINAARQLKNPSEAPTPALQLQATNAKLLRLLANPKYQGLKDEHKKIVLQKFYGDYVEPTFKSNNIADPGFDRWLQGRHAESYDQNNRPKESNFGAYVSGAHEGWGDVMRLSANLLSHKIPWAPATTNKINKEVSDKIKAYLNGYDKVDASYHAVFQPAGTKTAWLSNTVGHAIGEAPAYLAVDAATGGLMPELNAMGKAGKVLKYLKEGGEIFGIDKGEGKSTQQATSDAIVGPLLGFGLHATVGKLVRYGRNAAGRAILNRMNAKATQLAVAGEPFANLAAKEADKLLPEGQKWLESGEHEPEPHGPEPVSAVDPKHPVVQFAAQTDAHMREQIAREFHPEKAKAAGDKSIWRNLSKTQRAKINAHIKATTQLAAETMPLVAPHVQTLANEHAIEQHLVDPIEKSLHEQVQQITRLNPAETLTEIQAAQIAESLNIDTPAQHLDLAYTDGEEYEPGEGASASLKAGYQVSYKRADNTLSSKDLVGSTADKFIHGTIKYLPDSAATSTGKIYFEHPEHHLLWIAKNSSAPAAVKRKALAHLSQEFGHSASTVERRAGWLREHVNDLERTGKLSSEGNIFRSTKLTERRFGTKWQRELYNDDVLASNLHQVKALMRANPTLKKTLEPLFKSLLALKNKSRTAAKVGERGANIDSIVDNLKGMN